MTTHEQTLKEAHIAAIRECMEAVPNKKKKNKIGQVRRFKGSVDMWGKEYADTFNAAVVGFNTCRSQIIANLERLLHKDEIS